MIFAVSVEAPSPDSARPLCRMGTLSDTRLTASAKFGLGIDDHRLTIGKRHGQDLGAGVRLEASGVSVNVPQRDGRVERQRVGRRCLLRPQGFARRWGARRSRIECGQSSGPGSGSEGCSVG